MVGWSLVFWFSFGCFTDNGTTPSSLPSSLVLVRGKGRRGRLRRGHGTPVTGPESEPTSGKTKRACLGSFPVGRVRAVTSAKIGPLPSSQLGLEISDPGTTGLGKVPTDSQIGEVMRHVFPHKSSTLLFYYTGKTELVSTVLPPSPTFETHRKVTPRKVHATFKFTLSSS